MYDKSNYINGSGLKAQSLEKYGSRDEVTKKWISINKRLNPNRSIREYNAIVIEAMSLCELVIQNTLKKDFIEGRFIDNINMLIEKGCPVSDDEFSKLKRIKWYRNMAAHNTETVVQEIINYESAKDTLTTIGRLLFILGALSNDDIMPAGGKLQANVGDIIGETCLLQELIGKGGSGRVFKAYHKRLDLTVAVKEISHDLIGSIDVENEKNMLLSLRNDGIPRIYDIIEDNQTCYLVMDYIEGQTLKEYIDKMGRLPVSAVIRLTKELCNIMNYLHNFRGGIIFRDLKPDNIMLDRQTHIHLIDFGISKRSGTRENGNIYSGTACYSSPEQLNGDECDKRADIYSLGGVIYFMAEGRDPSEDSEQSYRRSTPEELVNIIDKAMARDKHDRYSSVEELSLNINDFEKNFRENRTSCQHDINFMNQPLKNEKTETNRIGAKSHEGAPVHGIFKKKRNLLLVPAAILGILILVFMCDFIYNSYLAAKSKDAASLPASSYVRNNAASSSTNTKSKQTSDARNTASNTGDDFSSGVTTLKGAAATAFGGKVILCAISYGAADDNLVVKGYIQNNYSKEITISPYDIYVMGNNGNKFPLDIYKELESNEDTSNIVPGEKRKFEFVFDKYKESSSLSLNITRVYCDFTNASFKLKLK